MKLKYGLPFLITPVTYFPESGTEKELEVYLEFDNKTNSISIEPPEGGRELEKFPLEEVIESAFPGGRILELSTKDRKFRFQLEYAGLAIDDWDCIFEAAEIPIKITKNLSKDPKESLDHGSPHLITRVTYFPETGSKFGTEIRLEFDNKTDTIYIKPEEGGRELEKIALVEAIEAKADTENLTFSTVSKNYLFKFEDTSVEIDAWYWVFKRVGVLAVADRAHRRFTRNKINRKMLNLLVFGLFCFALVVIYILVNSNSADKNPDIERITTPTITRLELPLIPVTKETLVTPPSQP